MTVNYALTIKKPLLVLGNRYTLIKKVFRARIFLRPSGRPSNTAYFAFEKIIRISYDMKRSGVYFLLKNLHDHDILINLPGHQTTKGGKKMRSYVRSIIFVLTSFWVLSWTAMGAAQNIVIGFSGPLSGPGAEYGQDCVNGLEMAVKELNAAGGISVKGGKYLFSLEKLDDRGDPTQALNNARRFRATVPIAAISSALLSTIAAMARSRRKGQRVYHQWPTRAPRRPFNSATASSSAPPRRPSPFISNVLRIWLSPRDGVGSPWSPHWGLTVKNGATPSGITGKKSAAPLRSINLPIIIRKRISPPP
jgi:hypothetical protein